MTTREREAFWRTWMREAAVDFGARLAETIGVQPSSSPEIRALVEQIIDVEQQLAAEVDT